MVKKTTGNTVKIDQKIIGGTLKQIKPNENATLWDSLGAEALLE